MTADLEAVLRYLRGGRAYVDPTGAIQANKREARFLTYASVVCLAAGVAAPIGLAIAAWCAFEWRRVGHVERAIERAARSTG